MSASVEAKLTRNDRRVRHVGELAQEHGITIQHRGRGIAYRGERRVTIPELRGQVSYYTALHEIGHIVGPNPRLRLEQEMAAWRWALDNAIEEPSPATARSILRCLASYRLRAVQGRMGTKLPEGFDAFCNEVARLAIGETA